MTLQRQIDRLLAQQASEWHQMLERGERADRASFVAWLKQSPLHVKEYLETAYADRVLDHLDPEKSEDVDALIAQAGPAVVPFSPSMQKAHRSRRRFSWIAVAAGLAFCAVSAAWIYQALQADRVFTTAIGEQRTLQLPDSSTVTLNTDSRIEVHIDEGRRIVELKRGEALFEVARDPARPFTVRTRTAAIQVLGTQFNVYERRRGARVSVLEGAVKVMPARSTARARNLNAGQQADVARDGSIFVDPDADVNKAIAWRERRLIFEDTPLEEMVREFNRYNSSLRLRLEDVAPESHHYNGTFSATDPQALATVLSGEPDLRIEKRDGEIVIRRQ